MGEHAKGQGKMVEAAERPVSNPRDWVSAVVMMAELGALDEAGRLSIIRTGRELLDAALDTDEPQGSSPTPSSGVPAVSPLNLDRERGLREVLEDSLCECRDEHLAAFDALVARVRALEAVTQAARALEDTRWTAFIGWEPGMETRAEIAAAHDAICAALAVVDGGGRDGQ